MGYEACGDQIHFPFELKLSPNPISEMQPCSSNSDQDREYNDDGDFNEYDDDGRDDDDDGEEEGSDVVADDDDHGRGDDENIKVDDYFPPSGTALMQELASKEMSLRQRLKF